VPTKVHPSRRRGGPHIVCVECEQIVNSWICPDCPWDDTTDLCDRRTCVACREERQQGRAHGRTA
jgi:hypothetical protein